MTGPVLALAVFVVVMAAFLLGHDRATRAVRDEQKRQSDKAEAARKAKDDEIAKLDVSAVDQRLDRWMRD